MVTIIRILRCILLIVRCKMLNILETTRLVCGLIFYAHFAVRGCGGFECHAAQYICSYLFRVSGIRFSKCPDECVA